MLWFLFVCMCCRGDIDRGRLCSTIVSSGIHHVYSHRVPVIYRYAFRLTGCKSTHLSLANVGFPTRWLRLYDGDIGPVTKIRDSLRLEWFVVRLTSVQREGCSGKDTLGEQGSALLQNRIRNFRSEWFVARQIWVLRECYCTVNWMAWEVLLFRMKFSDDECFGIVSTSRTCTALHRASSVSTRGLSTHKNKSSYLLKLLRSDASFLSVSSLSILSR